MTPGRLVLALLAALPVTRPLAAQLPQLPQSGAPFLKFSGELGTFGELYRRTGAPGRRPGETARIYLDASASVLGTVTVGVDLIASTEDGASLGQSVSGLPGRQTISQLGLHPQWKWGRAHIGAFSDNYSPFTYSAVQLRGAAFDVQAGPLLIGALGGRADAAVYGGAVNGAYKRTMAGGRIGLGRQEPGVASTFVTLTMIRAWDDPNSLPPVDTTLPPNAPLPGGTVPVNPYAVTPEENVVASASAGVALLKGKVAWRGELAGAVHSRDVRASELDSAAADVPGALRGLITPRVGTHGDYAFTSEIQLRRVALPGATPRSPRGLTASLTYRYVGPGYTALGVSSLANDAQSLDGRAGLRFARWSLQLQGGTQHDNLLGQKTSTTNRYRLGTTFNLRVSPVWNASLRASVSAMSNGRADSLNWMDYSARMAGMSHSFAFGPRRRVESLTLDLNWQDAGDDNPQRSASSFAATSVNARLAIRLGAAVQVVPSAGLTRSRSDTSADQMRATAGVSASWRMWQNRLTTTGSLQRSGYSNGDNWMGVLGARLRVTERDDLTLGLQVNRYADTAVPDRNFNEETFTLRWARRL